MFINYRHKQKDYPEAKFSLAFIGYGNEKNDTVIELTYNWDKKEYNQGDAFGHIAIEVDDAYQACEDLEAGGAKIISPAKPMNAGTRILAFIEDPDGYVVELNEKLNLT